MSPWRTGSANLQTPTIRRVTHRRGGLPFARRGRWRARSHAPRTIPLSALSFAVAGAAAGPRGAVARLRRHAGGAAARKRISGHLYRIRQIFGERHGSSKQPSECAAICVRDCRVLGRLPAEGRMPRALAPWSATRRQSGLPSHAPGLVVGARARLGVRISRIVPYRADGTIGASNHVNCGGVLAISRRTFCFGVTSRSSALTSALWRERLL
jgi:hypothetical protein